MRRTVGRAVAQSVININGRLFESLISSTMHANTTLAPFPIASFRYAVQFPIKKKILRLPILPSAPKKIALSLILPIYSLKFSSQCAPQPTIPDATHHMSSSPGYPAIAKSDSGSPVRREYREFCVKELVLYTVADVEDGHALIDDSGNLVVLLRKQKERF